MKLITLLITQRTRQITVRKSQSANRVPDTEEFDVDMLVMDSQLLRICFPPLSGLKLIPSFVFVCLIHSKELGHGSRRDESSCENESRQSTSSVGSSRETKEKDFIANCVVVAKEVVG